MKKNKIRNFDISHNNLLRDMRYVNKKIIVEKLDHINLTIDFENETAIPSMFLLFLDNENVNLEIVIKGDNLLMIDTNFLNHCSALTSITFPHNIRIILSEFMCHCTSLINITCGPLTFDILPFSIKLRLKINKIKSNIYKLFKEKRG